MNKYKFFDKDHVHTLNGAPLIGTTTVVGVIAKPLTWWASGLAVTELGWLNPKEHGPLERLESAAKMQNEIVGMQPEEYLDLLNRAYSAHSKSLKKSAGKGTDMHAELERYVKACIERGGEPEQTDTDSEVNAVKVFSEWAIENVDRFLVSEGYCYSERLWIGGILDCYAKLKNGHNAIIDFKSSREAYISQHIQVALYDIQVSGNGLFDENGERLFEPMEADEYIIFPFGAEKVEPSILLATEELKEGAEAAVKLYKITNE